MFTQLQAKLKRHELVTQTRNEKMGSPNFSSRLRRRSRRSCVRSLLPTRDASCPLHTIQNRIFRQLNVEARGQVILLV